MEESVFRCTYFFQYIFVLEDLTCAAYDPFSFKSSQERAVLTEIKGVYFSEAIKVQKINVC